MDVQLFESAQKRRRCSARFNCSAKAERLTVPAERTPQHCNTEGNHNVLGLPNARVCMHPAQAFVEFFLLPLAPSGEEEGGLAAEMQQATAPEIAAGQSEMSAATPLGPCSAPRCFVLLATLHTRDCPACIGILAPPPPTLLAHGKRKRPEQTARARCPLGSLLALLDISSAILSGPIVWSVRGSYPKRSSLLFPRLAVP